MIGDKITLERIDKAHPSIRAKLRKDYLDCNNTVLGKGVRLRFASVYRSFKEQQVLYEQGRSKPGKIVTNAEPGESFHNYGLAFDIVLLYDRDGNGTFEAASWDRKEDFDQDQIADWQEVINFFEKRGYRNGAYFGDHPHFDITFGLRWHNLKKRYTEGKVDSEGYVDLSEIVDMRKGNLMAYSPAEKAIVKAVEEVEVLGADPELTKALTKLLEAKDLVTEFITRE